MHCENCNYEIPDDAIMCVNCGEMVSAFDPDKDWLITVLLVICVGVFGVHRFYTGHTGIGILQLLTFGGFGIWVIIDLIMIVTDKYKDANGNKLVKN